MNTLVQVILFMSLARSACSGKTFQKLIKYVKDPDTKPYYPDPDQLHNEYIYGDCATNNKTKYYAEKYIPYRKLKGKVITRGWLQIKHLPSCIILRGKSFEEDNYRATAFNFQICVARLTYIHSRRTWRYYYYEWYIPHDITGTMNWDIFFYGPRAEDW